MHLKNKQKKHKEQKRINIQTNKNLLNFQKASLQAYFSCQGYFSVEIHNLQSDWRPQMGTEEQDFGPP